MLSRIGSRISTMQLEKQAARRRKQIDIGVCQINYNVHGRNFKSIEQMINPFDNIYHAGLVIILTTCIIITVCAVDWIDHLPRADGNKMASAFAGSTPPWLQPLINSITTIAQTIPEKDYELEELYEKVRVQEERIRVLTNRTETRDAEIKQLREELNRLRARGKRTCLLEKDTDDLQAKQAFNAPSSDDISSEDSVDRLNIELTMLNNELAQAEEDKRALRAERDYLDGLAAARAEELEALEEENETLKFKLGLYTEKFRKVRIRVRPSREKEDEICPICFNDVSGAILMGSYMCYSSHAVCVDCFNMLRENEPNTFLCPTCRFQWFEPDIMIWAPNDE